MGGGGGISLEKERKKFLPITVFTPKLQTLTFDVDSAIKKSDWSHTQQVGKVTQPNLERVAVIQLKVKVNVQAKVSLNGTTQGVKQMLM